MTKQQTIDTLKQQLPGFFSVEQVIEMISKIEEPKELKIGEDQIKELVDNIVEEITDSGKDIVDNYELYLSGNVIEIDSIDFDNWSITTIVNGVINNWIKEMKEEENS